jgi:hypothetical protein
MIDGEKWVFAESASEDVVVADPWVFTVSGNVS